MTHSHVRRDSVVCDSLAVYVLLSSTMIRSYVNHDSCARVLWLTRSLRIIEHEQHFVCVNNLFEWHGSCTRVVWLICTATRFVRMWTMTHLHVCCDSLAGYVLMEENNISCVRHYWFTRATWLIRTCAVTHSQATHRWVRPTTRRCDKTHSNVCHDSFVRVSWLTRRLHIGVRDQQLMCDTRLIRTCAMTQSYVCRGFLAGYTSLGETNNSCPNPLLKQPNGTYLPAHTLYLTNSEQHLERKSRVDDLTGMCAVTHGCVCHDACMCAIYVCHDAFVCVPWFICLPAYTFHLTNSVQHLERKSFVDNNIGTCALTHVYVCHDSFVRLPSRICMCAMTHLPPRLHSLLHELGAPLRI